MLNRMLQSVSTLENAQMWVACLEYSLKRRTRSSQGAKQRAHFPWQGTRPHGMHQNESN